MLFTTPLARFTTGRNLRPTNKIIGRLSRRKAKQQFLDPGQHSFSGRLSADGQSQSSSLALLKFRKDTDAISQNLHVSSDGLRKWIEDFLQLGRLRLVGDRDSGNVARVLHNLDRKYRSDKAKDSRKLVNEMVETVRKAYVAGLIPSTASFALHLFAYYKESGHFDQGIGFWNWISRADDALLDPVLVGAAIEMLAVYGAGINYCEDIYQRALDQQTDISSQYHLSPGAILPDRSKAVTVRGTSLGLLQGILTARLLYGKWHSAYLTLDTALRLRPTQMVPRILDLFIYERPISEALSIYYMYCRGGNVVPGSTLMALLKSIKALADRTNAYTTKVSMVKAAFLVLEAYIGSGGVLSTMHLNMVARSLISALPRNHITKSGQRLTQDIENITKTSVDTLTSILDHFSTSNAPPNRVTFDGIISPALSLGYPNLVQVALQDMRDLDLWPEKPAALDLLRAAYLLQDPAMLKTAWACLRNLGSSKQEQVLDARSWTIMAVAAKACGVESFLQEQLEDLVPRLPVEAKTAIDLAEEDSMQQLFSASQESKAPCADDIQAFRCLCETVQSSLTRMKRLQPGIFRDLKSHPINEDTIFEWPDIAEEVWQRKLYDEMTLEVQDRNPHAAQVDKALDLEQLAPAVSGTGIPFDELRYLNWKTINKLLVQTETFEKRRGASMDTAMDARKASPQQRSTMASSSSNRDRYSVNVEQFQQYQRDAEKERARRMTEEEWRHRILELRNPDYDLLADTHTLYFLQIGVPALHHVHTGLDPSWWRKDQFSNDAGKPTGEGGGGGGCSVVESVLVERANFGLGEAMTARDRSCSRQLLVARERRRRLRGSGEDIVEDI
ncbi:MAG: hypothetical protein Q9218_001054 [Villophora microphyllina]